MKVHPTVVPDGIELYLIMVRDMKPKELAAHIAILARGRKVEWTASINSQSFVFPRAAALMIARGVYALRMP